MATILVVDDHLPNQKLLATLLGDKDHRLIETAFGSAGVALARAEHPDLIMANILMPAMNGDEFVRQLRADPALAQTPIIFYTDEPELTPGQMDALIQISLHLASEKNIYLHLDLQYYAKILEQEVAERHKAEQLGIEELEIAYQQSIIYARELRTEVTEHRQAQAALAESQHRLQSLFDYAQDAILLADDQARYVDANPAACELFGYSREELLQLAVWDITPIPNRDRALQAWQSFIAEGGRSGEFTALRRDGTLREIEFRAVANIVPGLHLSVLRDITARKRIEETLRESEERYRSLVEASPDIIVLTDLNIHILMINQQGITLLGYKSAAEMIGKSAFDFIVPEEWLRVRENIQKTRETGEVRSVEYTLLKKDGARLPVELSASLIRDIDGKPKAFTAVLRDISERKQAEAARAQLAAIVESSNEAIIGKTLDGVIVSWNKAAERLYGYAASEVTGRPIAIIIPPDRLEEFQGIMARLRQGEQIQHFETVRVRKDGRLVEVSVIISPVKDDSGKIIGASAIAHDITERKRAEAEVRRHTARMETLAEISQALAKVGLDEQAVLETIVRYTAEAIGDASRITLLSGDEQWFRPVAFHHPKPEVKALMNLVYPFTPISASQEWMASILRTGQPILIPIVPQEPLSQIIQPEYLPFVEQAGFHSMLIVPLRVEGRVIGTLGLTRHQPGHPYTSEDQVLLQNLADRAALTLQNARLFEQVQGAHERLQTLSRRLLEVQETERRHLARELHDEIGQTLTGLKLILGMSARLPAEKAHSNLAEAQVLLNDLMDMVHELSLNLRPPLLDDLGLLSTLLWYFERYTQQTHIRVTFQHFELEGRRFAPEVETATYRLVQEALTNVARHAGIGEVKVQLWTNPDMLFLQVEDQGRGFDPQIALASGASNGLSGMRERATLLGGRLIIEAAPGVGASLTAELPFPGRDK